MLSCMSSLYHYTNQYIPRPSVTVTSGTLLVSVHLGLWTPYMYGIPMHCGHLVECWQPPVWLCQAPTTQSLVTYCTTQKAPWSWSLYQPPFGCLCCSHEGVAIAHGDLSQIPSRWTQQDKILHLMLCLSATARPSSAPPVRWVQAHETSRLKSSPF